jgi:hypothetical protein
MPSTRASSCNEAAVVAVTNDASSSDRFPRGERNERVLAHWHLIPEIWRPFLLSSVVPLYDKAFPLSHRMPNLEQRSVAAFSWIDEVSQDIVTYAERRCPVNVIELGGMLRSKFGEPRMTMRDVLGPIDHPFVDLNDVMNRFWASMSDVSEPLIRADWENFSFLVRTLCERMLNCQPATPVDLLREQNLDYVGPLARLCALFYDGNHPFGVDARSRPIFLARSAFTERFHS